MMEGEFNAMTELSHLVAMRTFFLPRALPPKILGIVRGLLTNIKSRNLHSIARNH
jgi:hypothetical protein